ncbi:glycerol-3-phosphate dehydrogenase/oxidase [Phenylobacterium montanum]|uniref:Glycerol-3-phosphate dehydrogenase/oxidase n=1 Tax=Phenylobacterium montanum TaxID=2823693 RepID=A0A975G0W0_9CAUL|nr:glycerol-3-phosphate dehydrogenase/oxidase [Caulobacter sp. S6]QUD88716.1 glycerol-3-phosphate dehydrogenase/oxidase [Caulobacter sp. S6]
MSDALDLRARARLFRDLESRVFDLVVIGGGVTGAGVARDAALRDLSVALLEARDFASGTSSRSSKMIHGGLRYLAQGDTALVKEAASERQVLRRIAPHLTRISPFIVPAPTLASVAKLRAGLWMFEKLGGAPAEERHQIWDRRELAEREPLLRADDFHAAAVYPEFLTDDSRLTVANVRAAAGAGAVVLSYAPVVALSGDPAEAAICRSSLPGETLQARVRGRVIVNAAGPWVDGVRRMEEAGADQRLTLTKGVHVVVPRSRIPINHTVILRGADKRGLFAVPRGDRTYIGTTDTFYADPDEWPRITREDIAYLFQAAERGLKIAPLSFDDISSVWSGVRPLIGQAGKAPSEISRRDEVWTGPSGVVTIAGGKLSAYRAMAERIVDLVQERLGRKASKAATAETPLPGGDGDHRALMADPALIACSEVATRLVELYGSEAPTVARDGGDVAAEARHAVLCEGALRLEDYWVRRSMRAWFGADAGLSALAPAADAMAGLLDWDAARTRAEIDACRRIHHESLAALAA